MNRKRSNILEKTPPEERVFESDEESEEFFRPTEEKRRRVLAWFLDFLNEDFDRLSIVDFEKRKVEARYYFMNPGPFLPYGIHGVDMMSRNHGKGSDIFGEFPEDYPWGERLRDIQRDLKELVEDVLHKPIFRYESLGAGRGGRRKIWEPPIWKIADVGLYLFRGSTAEVFYNAGGDYSKMGVHAKVNFVHAMNGISPETIKQCQECGKYFLHLSAKAKYYCNPMCTTKALSRKRRETDPEGYRAKQREIMRRVYRERQAKKLGVSPDKVKIQKKSPSRARRERADGNE